MTIKSLKWYDNIWLYGIPLFLNYFACKIVIPYFQNRYLLPIEVLYFISVGGLVLLPMFIWSFYLSAKDIGSWKLKDIFLRMRIKNISRIDWIWTVASFLFLSGASFLVAKIILPILGMNASPFFFQNMPLNSEHIWILYIWPIFFFFNIFGEEFLWRGYIQPRQELLAGRWTWLLHGFLWATWHLPMGLDLILSAIPIFLILPAVVQIRKNTSIAIIVHAVFGAFGFLALAFGAVH